MTPYDRLLAEWREANRLAMEAENTLFAASMAYARGHGPKPSEAQFSEVARLRQDAKHLFQAAMDTFDQSRTGPAFPRDADESGSPKRPLNG